VNIEFNINNYTREDLHRIISKNISEIICLFDINKKLVLVSPSIEKVLGYSPDEINGQNWKHLIRTDQYDDFMSIIDSGLISSDFSRTGNRTKKTIEIELVKKDGSHIYAEIERIFLTDASDTVTGFFVSIRDITERKKTENEVLSNEKKFRYLIEKGSEVITILDDRGIIKYESPNHLRLLGYTDSEMIGHNAFDFIHPQDRPGLLEIFMKQISINDENSRVVYRSRHKNGSYRWIETTATNLLNDPDIAGVVCNSRDITDQKIFEESLKREIELRKEIEEDLRTLQQIALKANNAKDEFLANMSHELRTPLNAIMGLSDKLREVENLTGEQKEEITFIYNAGEDLLRKLNDILDISKIESQNLTIDKDLIDLNEMLSESLVINRHIAVKKGVTIEENIPPGLGTANADRPLIKQVIYNLLSNAIKFTEKGKRIGVDALRSMDEIYITVWDQGTGIETQNLGKIFDKFEQLQKGQSGKKGGTGLGLSISKKIVELHSGKLLVTSKIGSGSRFTIILPLSETDFMEPADEGVEDTEVRRVNPGLSGANHQYKILIVEDDPVNMTLINRTLEKAGYSIHCSQTGEEGIEKAKLNCFGMILMDIGLPGMDGIEAMKRIRDICSSRGVDPHVVALTANAMKGDREKYLNEGFDHYISKPFNREDLLSYIQRLSSHNH